MKFFTITLFGLWLATVILAVSYKGIHRDPPAPKPAVTPTVTNTVYITNTVMRGFYADLTPSDREDLIAAVSNAWRQGYWRGGERFETLPKTTNVTEQVQYLQDGLTNNPMRDFKFTLYGTKHPETAVTNQ